MIFNLCSLVCNVGGCLIGLTLYRSLSVVNYSIAGSFLVFHLLQDVLLIRKGISTWTATAGFYAGIAVFVLLYQYCMRYTMAWVPFVIVGLGVVLIMLNAIIKSGILHPPKQSVAEV